MTTRTRSMALALAVSVGLISLVQAEDLPLPKFYKGLADKNHYPVAEGLTSAQADVKCNIFDTVRAAFPDAADKPIAVKFLWNRANPQAAPQMKIAVTGIPADLTDLSNRANLVFQPITEFVIPSPPYWTFEQTAVKAASDAGKISVTGTAKSAESPIKGLSAEVDATTYLMSKMELDLGQAKITFEMTGKDLGGKWGIETETISYPQFKRVLKFEYTQVDTQWLPSKLTLDNLGLDGKQLEPTYIFEFSHWQVNKGVPEGSF